MNLNLQRHIKIHLQNPDHNYILSENCPYCKHDRRISYGKHFQTPRTVGHQVRFPIDYRNIYDASLYPTLHDRPRAPEPISPVSSNTVITYFDTDSVYSSYYTSLKEVNHNSELSIYLRGNQDAERCPVCCSTIQSFQIVRTLFCGHRFHHECVDRWLENKNTCPVCRFTFSDL